jgi:hypothetical protein
MIATARCSRRLPDLPVFGQSRDRLCCAAMRFSSALVALATLLLLWLPSSVHAERNTLGPHLGYNFDGDVPFIGGEGRFDVANIASSVIVQLNPSFSLYIDDHPGFNFSFNVPFEFQIPGSVLRPFAAPGIALIDGTARGSRLVARLNLIGGLLFHLDSLEPFVQLRFICGGGGISPELMGGLLFRL